MYLPILSLLYLLTTLLTWMVAQSGALRPLFWILTSLFLLYVLGSLVFSSFLASKKREKNTVPTTLALLGFTTAALLVTYLVNSVTGFAPWCLLLTTLLLLAEGYLLTLYLSYTTSHIALLGGVSSLIWLTSFAILPFSPILLVLTLFPLGVFMGVHHRKRRGETSPHKALQSMLAHEIRTPLTVMQTTTTLLLEEVPGPLNPQQKQFVQSNYAYTQRLILFSENMLMLIKLEKEFELAKREKINIRQITGDIVEFFGPQLHIKEQTIRYSLPALVHTPLGDETLVRQVFINLIHNAIKHTQEGGYIDISVTQDDEQVVVSISDNGTGVVGEGREHLFKEFYQEERASQAFQDGFGLGLSIARQIIEKHGGKVYITSVKEKGTVVSFTLPAKAVR